MVLLKGKSESNGEQSQPAYTGKLPGKSITAEVESCIEVVANDTGDESLLVRSKRELPGGFAELVLRMHDSDTATFIVHADTLIDALSRARERDAG